MAYSPDGRSLAVADTRGSVRLFRAADGEQEALYDSHHAEGVAFSPDGRTLATCGRNGRVRLWDLRTETPRRTLDTEDVRLWCVTFSPDGRRLLTGGDDGIIRTWDLAETQVPHYLPTSVCIGSPLAFTPDGATLAVANNQNNQGLVSFWDLHSSCERPELSHLNAWSSKHNRSISYGANGTVLGVLEVFHVQLWEPRSQRLIAQRDLGDLGTRLCCRPGCSEWTICRLKLPLLRWDAASGKDLPTGVGDEPCGFATWSPDGTTLAVSQSSKGVRLLRTGTGDTVLLPADVCQYVTFSPDGATLATGHGSGEIRLWETAGGKLRRELVGHRLRIASLAFSPDGKVLASGSEDGTVRLWHLASGREYFSLPARPGGPVSTVAFSPDGTLLAAGYENGRDRDGVALWRATPP
jgi:WD40 repeat protein